MITQTLAEQRDLEAIKYSLRELAIYFDDDNITDIWANKDGKVSIKKFGSSREETNLVLTSQEIQNIIIQIANKMGINIDRTKYPILEGQIPHTKARITGVLSPWTETPFLAIRKPPKRIYTIENYIENNQITQDRADFIIKAIKDKKNILVSGSPNAGKTTFTNAIIQKMTEFTPNDGFLIIEDNPEIQCNAKFAEPILIPTDQAIDAVKLSLRLSCDRIIFGEIRTGDVLWNLLDAWNTGNPGGVSTIHANSAEATFLRMRMLLGQTFKIVPPVNQLIDIIVHLRRHPDTGIEVDEVIHTQNYSEADIEEIAKRSIEQGM